MKIDMKIDIYYPGYLQIHLTLTLSYYFLKKTAVRIPLGAPNETHLEPHQIGVEQFLEMLRFEQRSKLEELPVTLR